MNGIFSHGVVKSSSKNTHRIAHPAFRRTALWAGFATATIGRRLTLKKSLRLTLLAPAVLFFAPVHLQAQEQEPTEQKKITLEKIGTYPCGKQPKQVLFSPDGNFIVIPLLEDTGFDVFSVKEKSVTQRITPPESEKHGFAEGIFIKEKNAFLVSQMTTGKVHEYSYKDGTFTYRRSIETDGTWSKVIAWSQETETLAVSNWVSSDISIISYENGSVTKKIKTSSAPRGLLFLNGGKEIISLSFEGGRIEKFSVETGKKISALPVEKSAMRHIVCTADGKTSFVSDMYHRKVYSLSMETFSIKKSAAVFNNPNTIALLNDKWLFVSCRGPNNQTDYTKCSPANGKIYVLSAADLSEEAAITGGNQPTGLALSPGGTLLCFSNFQDATLELWNIITP